MRMRLHEVVVACVGVVVIIVTDLEFRRSSLSRLFKLLLLRRWIGCLVWRFGSPFLLDDLGALLLLSDVSMAWIMSENGRDVAAAVAVEAGISSLSAKLRACKR